jgi:hypothetical protein
MVIVPRAKIVEVEVPDRYGKPIQYVASGKHVGLRRL